MKQSSLLNDEALLLAEAPAKIREIAADWLDVDIEDVVLSASFIDLGLQSSDAVLLCGELEEHFGVSIDPIIAFEQDTVAGFIEAIVELIRQRSASPTPDLAADTGNHSL